MKETFFSFEVLGNALPICTKKGFLSFLSGILHALENFSLDHWYLIIQENMQIYLFYISKMEKPFQYISCLLAVNHGVSSLICLSFKH